MYVTSRKNMSANEEMELMKELKTLASKDNADNNQAAVKEADKKAKWARHSAMVSTPKLLKDAMANDKIAADKTARENLHAVMKQIVTRKMPIQENDGGIMNMREQIMRDLDKVKVQPEELYPTPSVDELRQRGETTGGSSVQQTVYDAKH